MDYETLVGVLESQEHFGILAGASTSEIIVYARNYDTSIGDLFLIPSERGGSRVYIFRMTEYANVLRREDEMDPMAKNLLALEDPFYSEDFEKDKLLRLTGSLLGYSEQRSGNWSFCSPRKLPSHLSKVYKVGFGSEDEVVKQEMCLSELLTGQLQAGVFVGNLLAGERALEKVRVGIPGEYFAHHLGLFGRTGTGKSNNLMVMIRSILENNRNLIKTKRDDWLQDDRIVSLFAIDPHDEFAKWKPGSAGGITRILRDFSKDEQSQLAEPFFYLSCRPQPSLDGDEQLKGLARQVTLHRSDITPGDLVSITDFTDVMVAAVEAIADQWGENWIGAVLNGEVQEDENSVHKASLAAIHRRLVFLAGKRSSLVPNSERYYSSLVDIVMALERGRVLDVDTSLMTEMEQFLLTTVVARTVFCLRKALKSSRDLGALVGDGDRPGEIDRHFPIQDTLKASLRERLTGTDSPYLDSAERLRGVNELPAVNIIVEEAPSVLNPSRIKFGSVFRDIARQGRKFGVGLTVVSQQVTEIDNAILSQLNTELSMALGNEEERKAAVQTASNDIFPLKRELQVMGVGEAVLSASYRRVPLTIRVPEF